ncbi:MAG TPA: TlpA disulfide reductase family protein [Methylomusa anaerophila]|nr:TlpA disulfide reductase family protein [Methylomusa anaerophila]HML89239.1 TlpA disulfide reductase family protein [Methylomusa anaerophila]
MNKKVIVTGAVIVVIMAMAYGAWNWAIRNPESSPISNSAKVSTIETGITVGKMMPQFSLMSLDGQRVTVAKSDQVIVLNFWATWCPPCREEMPELEQFYKRYGSTVQFYAINIQEPADKVAGFMKDNQYTFRTAVLLDGDGAVARTYRINAIPTSIVIDKAGIIRYRTAGTVTLAELEGVLKGL